MGRAKHEETADDAAKRDRVFDGLADKFAAGLYGTPRGAIRLAVLEHVVSCPPTLVRRWTWVPVWGR